VLQARGESAQARAALNDLCTAYYAPVQSFLRHSVRRSESADDLTNEFFTRVLSGRAFEGVDPQRGRFRSFLLGAVKHFLADVRDCESALKRGGRTIHISLKPATDTSPGVDVAALPGDLPEAAFQKQWALTVLDRALHQLQSEMAIANRATQFEALKPWLTGSTQESQAEAAMAIGITENAFKVSVHRLRKRFRQLVISEIAQTVLDPIEQQAELDDLILALGS
jgi:RNA polymerase sigma-70 factor (ECF subfamily)